MVKNKFTKKQLISSNKYKNERDLLHVILSDDKVYRFEEVDRLIIDFTKIGVS